MKMLNRVLKNSMKFAAPSMARVKAVFQQPVKNRVAALAFVLLILVLPGCPEKGAEVEGDIPDVNGPMPAQTVSVRAGEDRVTIIWEIPTMEDSIFNRDIRGFLILRTEEESENDQPMREENLEVGDPLGGQVVIALIDAKPTQNEEITLFWIDKDLERGTTYHYRIFTYDEVPNYSEPFRLEATPGALVHPRMSHAQVVLSDGRILLTGGVGFGGPLDAAELFDPEEGSFVETSEAMHKTRFAHTSTLLEDGRVLILGGYEEGFKDTLSSAELFDPDTESFRLLESSMHNGRALHSATRLPDGRVIIIGGGDGVNAFDTAEIYDPEDESFALVEDLMSLPRHSHSATLLVEAEAVRLMIAGGLDGEEALGFATFYNPDTGDFGRYLPTPAEEETPMIVGRIFHTATLLPDGRVVLTGGFSGAVSTGAATDSIEVFRPETAAFEEVARLNTPRSGHVAFLREDGVLVIAGGIDDGLTILSSSEIFDPATGEVSPGPSLNYPRTVAKSSPLPEGGFLVTGGNRSNNVFLPHPLSTAEVLEPGANFFSLYPPR